MDSLQSDVREGMRIDWDAPIRMDDGLVLRADIFRPLHEGRYPVLLSYGPYAKGLAFQEGYPSAWERMIAQHYRERRLDTQLEKLGNTYEYIVLDCPPNLGVITVNAIYTADLFLIPTTYGRYSLDGIADLFASIEEIREGEGDCWILRNAFDSRNRATNTYIDEQLASVRQHVLRTVIRRSEAINQAQINGEPVLTFDPQGHGAEDFRALTKEVLQHG